MPGRNHQPLKVCAAVVVAIGALSSPALAASVRPVKPEVAVNDYCAAWSVTGRGDRDRMLGKVWAANGVYSDPEPTYAIGVKGLSDAIGEFQRHYPGAHFRCSQPQKHHRFMRVTWVLLRSDGTQVTHGVDFYDMAQDGRIQRIVGFFGDPPAVGPRREEGA